MKRILRFLAPPVFADDEEKTRNARLLNIITISSLVGALLFTPFVPAERVPYISLAIGIILIIWLIMRRGYIKAASIAMVAGISIVLIIGAVTSGGVRAPGYGAFIVIILFTGLLLGWKASVGMTIFSVLCGALLFEAESLGLLPKSYEYNSAAYWILGSVYFIMSGAMLTLALRMIEDALRRANRELAERKQAEEELFQFRKVMDETGDAVFLIDPQTSHYIGFNRSAYEYLGYSGNELSRLGVIDVAEHITSLEVWRERVELVSRKGNLLFETVYRRKDGTTFPVEVNARMVKYGGQTIMLALARDITDRKQAEEIIRQSEDKYRTLTEQIPAMVYLDRYSSGETLYISPYVKTILGYSPEEWIANPKLCDDIMHPEDRERMVGESENAQRNNRFALDYRYIARDGRVVWVRDEAILLRDDSGEPKYWQGVMLDITAQKQAEEALSESEERFRKIFHYSPIAICITSLNEGRLLDGNYAYWELSGYDPETSIGKDYIELKMWDRPSDRAQFVEKLKQKRSFYSPDYVFMDTKGNQKYAIAFYELIEIGHEDCVLSMFYDMSAQKATMQALQQSEARARALLEAVPDLIFEFSLDGTFLKSIQPSVESLLMPPDQFIGKNVREAMPESVAEQTISAIQNVLRTGKLETFEYQLQMNDGNHEYEARIVASGADTALAIVRDITQRKWAETERERFINELEIKNRESETLRASLASIVTTFDLEQVVERILDQMKLVIPYDSASVWRVEGEWQTLILSRDLPPEISSADLKFRVDQDNSSRPIIYGEKPFVLSNNVQQELPDFQGAHSYINSWLAVPLKKRDKIIGLIALDGISKDQFNAHHAELAVTFANQVAIALENASLFTDLQGELQKQIALRSAAMAISSSLHLNQVLNEICKQMCVVNNGTSAYISQYDDAYSHYMVMADYMGADANAHELVSDLGLTYYKKDGAYIFDETKGLDFEAIHSDDENLSPWTRDIFSRYEGRSILYIPLYVQGRLLGHAELWDSRNRREFTRDEISFCRTLSQQAAIAIANANLFEQLQKELSGKKDLIAELESKNAELERFTYTVSHDLKSPLFTIRGFLGYLEQDALAGNHERLKADMQRITDATEKMQNLLNDLLELSRVGRLKNESVNVPFEELAREAVELVQGRIMERGVSVHIDSNLPLVFGDKPRLLEVLQNLIDNAAKFTGAQKEPRIEIGQSGTEGGMIVFHVRDNGVGIPPEHHERIFGLFNKLDVKSEGTGIGLALVRRIIEVHEGRIWVESEAGKGAAFYFTLPPTDG